MHSCVEMKKWAVLLGDENRGNLTKLIDDMRYVSRSLNFRFNDTPEV